MTGEVVPKPTEWQAPPGEAAGINLMDGEGKRDKSVVDKMDWLALEEN